jgi:hypothetical protein
MSEPISDCGLAQVKIQLCPVNMVRNHGSYVGKEFMIIIFLRMFCAVNLNSYMRQLVLMLQVQSQKFSNKILIISRELFM